MGLKSRKISVKAQKMDGTTLETYEIVVSTFFMLNKNGREKFFKESFLLSDVKPDVVIKIAFLTINNINVNFQAWDLEYRS